MRKMLNVRTALGAFAVAGLALSLSAIVPQRTQAAPKSSRALTAAEMKATQGAGRI